MDELEKNMEDLLNIDVDLVEKPKQDTKINPSDTEDKIKDYEYTRGELYSLISKGQEAVQGALEVAQESGHPRAYEVAAGLIKNLSDLNKDLLELQNSSINFKDEVDFKNQIDKNIKELK